MDPIVFFMCVGGFAGIITGFCLCEHYNQEAWLFPVAMIGGACLGPAAVALVLLCFRQAARWVL